MAKRVAKKVKAKMKQKQKQRQTQIVNVNIASQVRKASKRKASAKLEQPIQQIFRVSEPNYPVARFQEPATQPAVQPPVAVAPPVQPVAQPISQRVLPVASPAFQYTLRVPPQGFPIRAPPIGASPFRIVPEPIVIEEPAANIIIPVQPVAITPRRLPAGPVLQEPPKAPVNKVRIKVKDIKNPEQAAAFKAQLAGPAPVRLPVAKIRLLVPPVAQQAQPLRIEPVIEEGPIQRPNPIVYQLPIQRQPVQIIVPKRQLEYQRNLLSSIREVKNPITNRWVDVSGKKGKEIIKKYEE